VLNTVRCFLPPLSQPVLSRVARAAVGRGARRLRQVEAGVTPASFFRLASFRCGGETRWCFLGLLASSGFGGFTSRVTAGSFRCSKYYAQQAVQADIPAFGGSAA